MAANVIVDAAFLVAMLGRRDRHHDWAVTQALRWVPPWRSCEAVITEAFYLLGSNGAAQLIALLRRAEVILSFDLAQDQEPVLTLLEKYADVPISLADACLVRMTEILPEPLLLTTDADFRVYRRRGRQVVPCVMPD
jgi:predicted nucleic acid-binding protein